MMFHATFNTISAISQRLVLLMEENGVSGEKPPTCCIGFINIKNK